MTLTREDIASIRAANKTVKPHQFCRIDINKLRGLLDLAETALACKPRPIEEAPANGRAELLLHDKWLWIANWWGPGVNSDSPTHFIPLSALPKPEVEE